MRVASGSNLVILSLLTQIRRHCSNNFGNPQVIGDRSQLLLRLRTTTTTTPIGNNNINDDASEIPYEGIRLPPIRRQWLAISLLWLALWAANLRVA